MKTKDRILLLITALLVSNIALAAENLINSYELKGGSILQGTIISEEDNTIKIRTVEGFEVSINRGDIVSIESGNSLNKSYSNANSTRLLFSPTGRPLKKGAGYFSDLYIILPSVSYGITDRFSILAGMSIVPAVGFGDQIKYIAPRYVFRESEKSASSVGLLNIFSGGDNAGIFYANHTIGDSQKSFTAAVGWRYDLDDFDLMNSSVIMLGGNIQLSRNTAFVTENWIFLNQSSGKNPFVFALRLFSNQLSVDLGAIILGDLIDKGIPLPWLSFSYHF